MSKLAGFSLLACAACASPPPAPKPAPAAPAPAAPVTASAAPVTAPVAPVPTAAPLLPPASVKLLTVTRVLDAPVHSLALGQKGRVAALGNDAWLDVGKGLQKLPRPPANDPSVTLYFGRDDQPRLMGISQGRGVYARFRKGGWERGASEIGKLGSLPMAPLFGVLGYDDPEVVCAPDRLCIVKRHTGWTMMAPPPGVPRVELCGKVAFAWDRAAVHRLGDAGWRALDVKPTFSRAEHLWAVSDADIWLAEREPSQVHHFDGKQWKAEPAAVQGPRALWATGASDVWLAADGGAAHFDGQRWSRVEGLDQPLNVVVGRSAREIWFAGQSGVWRGLRD